MEILRIAHSDTRWLLALAAVVLILKFAWGWLKGGSYKKIDRILTSAFSGLLDLQATLGLIFLLWTSAAGVPFSGARAEHLTTMLLAVILGHLPARWKNSDDKTKFRNTLFCALGALVFIITGVIRLRGGWVWE